MTQHPIPHQPQLHHLPATPATVHWGYFDGTLTPVLTIRSGGDASTRRSESGARGRTF